MIKCPIGPWIWEFEGGKDGRKKAEEMEQERYAYRGGAGVAAHCLTPTMPVLTNVRVRPCRRKRLRETGRGPAFNPQLTARSVRSRSSRSVGRRSSGGSGGSRSRGRSR